MSKYLTIFFILFLLKIFPCASHINFVSNKHIYSQPMIMNDNNSFDVTLNSR